MRIISQDGMIDLPYESIGVSINYNDDCMIIAYPAGNVSSHNGYWVMARYLTAGKAKKVIEMLRDAYSPEIKIKEPVRKELPKSQYSDWSWSGSEPQVEVLNNFYFQFPKDDEMEI